MGARSKILGAAMVLALSLVANPALGQAWRGVPLLDPVLGVGLNAGFPEGSDWYGAEVFKGLGGATIGAEYQLSTYEGDTPSAHTVGVNGAYNLPLPTTAVNIAPVAGASYTSWDDTNIVQIPLGANVAIAVPAGPGMTILPYATPQFVWTRHSMDSVSESDSDFGFRAGGNLVVENLFFGASYGKVGDGDGTFGVNAGVILR